MLLSFCCGEHLKQRSIDFVEIRMYNTGSKQKSDTLITAWVSEERKRMRKKWNVLALSSFAIALAIFIFTFILFHYMSPAGGLSSVYQENPAKPFVTLLFGIWGVMFLFSSVMSFLVGQIFFSKK